MLRDKNIIFLFQKYNGLFQNRMPSKPSNYNFSILSKWHWILLTSSLNPSTLRLSIICIYALSSHFFPRKKKMLLLWFSELVNIIEILIKKYFIVSKVNNFPGAKKVNWGKILMRWFSHSMLFSAIISLF